MSEKGLFGQFGGSYVPEDLQKVLEVLADEFEKAKNNPAFIQEFKDVLTEFVGRENPLTYVKNLSEQQGGARIYLKREDLNHKAYLFHRGRFRLSRYWT